MTAFSRSDRRQVLESCGAAPSTVDQLLAYGESMGGEPLALPTVPLADELHVEAWRHYEEEARGVGAIEALKPHFVQLRFPVAAGMSSHEAYRRATRQGRFEEADAFGPGLALRRPKDIELHVCLTMGGHIPVITTGERDDFVALVRAFTERNEPALVPSAMGACLVRGLINWSRIAAFRARWESQHPDAGASEWTEEFRRLAERKALYQDRLVILSRGPYSAVASAEIGFEEADWLARSLIIRREHEFTHYFTSRGFGSIRNHIQDELVADFVGLFHAFGYYRSDLALRFLGCQSSLSCLADGRFMIYRGQPPLSDEAMAVVSRLAVRVARNLEAIGAACLVPSSDRSRLGRLTLALFSLSLEELASADAPNLVNARLSRGSQAQQSNPGGTWYGG